MKKLLFLLILFLPSWTAQAQDVTGKWYGKADLGVMSMRIVFDIVQEDGGWSGSMLSQSPDQSEQWIPFSSVGFEGNTLKASVERIGFSYVGKLENDSLKGSLTQAGNLFALNFSREEALVNRPQEPKPPYPYHSEEITFQNEGAGITLAGTLTVPEGTGPFPAVVLVSGSGPQDRNEQIVGHKPFWVIADHLTRNGIAVLRYDDRGTAASGGDYAAATLSDFVSDALAAIGYLRLRPEAAAGKVGLIGHSQGGMVALMLAAKQQTDFIVMLAGPGVDGRKLLDMQRAAIMTASGASDFFVEQYNRKINEAIDAALSLENKAELRDSIAVLFAGTPLENAVDATASQLSSPGMKSFFRYDPSVFFPEIRCPVLALNGEKDLQVPAGPNLEAIHKGLLHNPNVSIKSYSDLNHLFQSAETGLPQEYGQIEETFNGAVLEDLTEWIREVTR